MNSFSNSLGMQLLTFVQCICSSQKSCDVNFPRTACTAPRQVAMGGFNPRLFRIFSVMNDFIKTKYYNFVATVPRRLELLMPSP